MKRLNRKRMLSFALALCMMAGLVPMKVFAAGGGGGTIYYGSIDAGNGQVPVWSRKGTLNDYYVTVSSTAGMGGVTVSESSVFLNGHIAAATNKELLWHFSGWAYSVVHDDESYAESTLLGSDIRYVSESGSDYKKPYVAPGLYISIYRGTRGTVIEPIYYTLSAVYSPLIYIDWRLAPAFMDGTANGTITCHEGSADGPEIALIEANDGAFNKGFAIPYDERVVLTFTPDKGYEIDYLEFEERPITLSAENRLGHSITTEKVIEPKKIKVAFREIAYDVKYDGNGASSGNMDHQNFTYKEEKALSENVFERTGYVFKGWNTKADGSGTVYEDGQTVSMLTSEQNGEVTLYAQWEKCTKHQWNEDKCTVCGLICDHSYTYTADANVITENCSGACGHEETAVLEQDDSVETVYEGVGIEALDVTYSEDWKGGALTVNYEDNVNAGTAKGRISIGNATAEETFEITKAPLTVTAKDKTITYGDSSCNGGAEYTGFVNGENEAVLGGTLEFDYNYVQGDDVGVYEITPKGLTSGNYKINFAEGELTVVPRELVITWDKTTLIYDGTEKFPDFYVNGIISGDDVQFECSGAATKAGKGYVAEITGITGSDAGNYKLPENTSITFEIVRKVQNSGSGRGNSSSSSARTGDGSSLWLWLSLFFVSGAGTVGVKLNRRKNNK